MLPTNTVFCSSWGYDQTNVSFYTVVKATGKQVVLQRIPGRFVDGQHVMPDLEATPHGEPLRRKVQDSGSVKISTYEWATPWSGEKQYQTPSGFGH